MRPPLVCPDLVGRLEQADKASIPDRLFALTVSDDYGFFSTIMPELVAHLPAHAVDHWDERLVEAERSLGAIKDWDRNWKKRAKADRIICLRQAIADCRQDVEAFIALEKSRPDGHHNTMAIAERLCDAGRHSEALEWVRKRGRPGLKVMTYDDLADGSSPRDVSNLARKPGNPDSRGDGRSYNGARLEMESIRDDARHRHVARSYRPSARFLPNLMCSIKLSPTRSPLSRNIAPWRFF
jgi:hypothetical protein